jgi:predicted amidohydrolase
MVVDPSGQILAAAGHDDAVLRATLDLSKIPSERGREPSLAMGRPDLYLLGPSEDDA